MHIFIIVLIVILVIIYIAQNVFFENFQNNTDNLTLYVFVSSGCPACKMYENNNHANVDKISKNLGIKYIKVNVNTDLGDPKINNIYKLANVQYIPYACLIKNDDIVVKVLGNGNSLSSDSIKDAMQKSMA